MKTNQKQLKLIQHGLKASTVTRLSESQVDILFNRLNESKKENKEQVTNEKVMVSGKNTAEVEKLKQTYIKEISKLKKEEMFPLPKKLSLWKKIKILLSGN